MDQHEALKTMGRDRAKQTALGKLAAAEDLMSDAQKLLKDHAYDVDASNVGEALEYVAEVTC